jgi:hypothetical protein
MGEKGRKKERDLMEELGIHYNPLIRSNPAL